MPQCHAELDSASMNTASLVSRGRCSWIPKRVRDEGLLGPSLEAVSNPALGQIVGGQLDQHLVAGEHANPVLAHLAGGVAKHLMAVFELHAEHGVRQQFSHLPA